MKNIYFFITLALVFLALILSIAQACQTDTGDPSEGGADISTVSQMNLQFETGREVLEVDDPMGADMDRLLDTVEELTEGDTE